MERNIPIRPAVDVHTAVEPAGGTVSSINPLVIIKPVIWMIKLGLWVLKKICKLLFSKVGFTILTLGLGLLAYKLLNKIYGD